MWFERSEPEGAQHCTKPAYSIDRVFSLLGMGECCDVLRRLRRNLLCTMHTNAAKDCFRRVIT